LELNLTLLPWVSISVIVGYVTTLAGAIGGVVLRKYVDESIFRHAAGLALILLGVKVAGAPIPSQMVLLAFLSGIAISIRKPSKET
jgi:hypothetical protein